MNKEKPPVLFRIVRGGAKLFYPRISLCGRELLPDEPCVLVGNHSQINGPLAAELYLPENCYTWCVGDMMELKSVPGYAYRDFWSEKPGWIRWFYKLLSYAIAPLSVLVFNNARTIPVYHDARLRRTFARSVEALEEGKSLVIFPEHDKPYNHIIYDFQDRFVDIARFYYKKSGRKLCFVPMYLAPGLKKLYFGRPVRFDPQNPINDERMRISAYLKNAITKIACDLPEHIVVPYKNLPRRMYRTNLFAEVKPSEESCC